MSSSSVAVSKNPDPPVLVRLWCAPSATAFGDDVNVVVGTEPLPPECGEPLGEAPLPAPPGPPAVEGLLYRCPNEEEYRFLTPGTLPPESALPLVDSAFEDGTTVGGLGLVKEVCESGEGGVAVVVVPPPPEGNRVVLEPRAVVPVPSDPMRNEGDPLIPCPRPCCFKDKEEDVDEIVNALDLNGLTAGFIGGRRRGIGRGPGRSAAEPSLPGRDEDEEAATALGCVVTGMSDVETDEEAERVKPSAVNDSFRMRATAGPGGDGIGEDVARGLVPVPLSDVDVVLAGRMNFSMPASPRPPTGPSGDLLDEAFGKDPAMESRCWFLTNVGTHSGPSSTKNRLLNRDSNSSIRKEGVDRYVADIVRVPRGCGTLGNTCVCVASGGTSGARGVSKYKIPSS